MLGQAVTPANAANPIVEVTEIGSPDAVLGGGPGSGRCAAAADAGQQGIRPVAYQQSGQQVYEKIFRLRAADGPKPMRKVPWVSTAIMAVCLPSRSSAETTTATTAATGDNRAAADLRVVAVSRRARAVARASADRQAWSGCGPSICFGGRRV